MEQFFCLLDSNNVLCLGGSPASKLVYLLDTSTQQLTPQSALSTPRRSAGVVKVGEFVYVFGGYSSTTASCEKFALTDKLWSNLRSMNADRYLFHSVVYVDDIYLASSQGGSRSIEVFNTERETFRTLFFRLPGPIPYNEHAFVVAGELYIAAQTYIGKWTIGSETEMKAVTIAGGALPYSNCPVFVLGKEALLVPHTTGALVQFNYETNSIVP